MRHPGEGGHVNAQLVAELTIFALAVFLGFELISKVPTMLHTPLMSGTNAIHGIVLIGAMLIVGTADSNLEKALGFVAVVFGTINIVGGFLVTDRMLEMFKQRQPDEDESESSGSSGCRTRGPRGPETGSPPSGWRSPSASPS
jgi:H+-translocating NAD(P) transhydrogenase subunit alpha